VHEEACRWEHVMSELVERRLIELLGHPTESPYGNPIPGLDQLGDVPARTFDDGVVGLVRLLNETGGPSAAPCGASPSRCRSTPNSSSSCATRASCPARRRLPLQRGLRARADGRQDDGLELPVEVASHIFLVDAVPA
jgi:DtxR family Mn-dependent transcriptional regulator